MSPLDSERGSVTLFVVVAVAGLLAMAGLAVDGGGKVRAVQRADRVAAEAARAAGQAIDAPAAILGAVPTVSSADAVAAGLRYLQAAGAIGTVHAVDGGRAVEVRVTEDQPTVFLGLIGVNEITVTGSAQVALVRGVSVGEPR